MTQRNLLTALLLCCFAFTAQAQLSAGISGGANLTFWEWKLKNLSTDIDFEPGPGWRAALQLEYKFSPLFSLRAELANQAFSNRLSDLTDQNGVFIPNSRISEYYNTFGGSLLAKLAPLKKENGPYLLAGSGLAYITNSWRKFSAGLIEGEDGPTKRDIDLTQTQIRREQWLADLGFGYAVSFKGSNHLSLEFRYQIGLGKFSNSPYVDTNLKSALLSVGYLRDL